MQLGILHCDRVDDALKSIDGEYADMFIKLLRKVDAPFDIRVRTEA